MREFTKVGICQYLAVLEHPIQPYLELRKMASTSSMDTVQFFLDNPNLLFPIFDPPKHYFAHPPVDPSKPFDFLNVDIFGYYYSCPPYINSLDYKKNDFLITHLTKDDEVLLRTIFGTNQFDNSKFTLHEYQTQIANFNRLLNSTDEFIRYCEMFTESEKKPNWDLIRVLVLDTQSNFQQRQQAYERLLNSRLAELISVGDIIQLGESYTFRKRDNLKIRTKLENDFAYPVCMFATIGKKLADYIHGQNNELIKIKFCHQINDIIKDAIYKGELPVHKLPSCQIVELNNSPSNDDVLIWGEVKLLLEERTGQQMFDKPDFDNAFSKAIHPQDEEIRKWQQIPKQQLEIETDDGSTRKKRAKKNKTPINKKVCQLHVLFWKVRNYLIDKGELRTEMDIWTELEKKYRLHDEEEIIENIEDDYINWVSRWGNKDTFKKSSLPATISELKKNPPF